MFGFLRFLISTEQVVPLKATQLGVRLVVLAPLVHPPPASPPRRSTRISDDELMNQLGSHNTLFRSPAQSATPIRSPRSATLPFRSPPSQTANAEDDEDFLLHVRRSRRQASQNPHPSPDIHPSHYRIPHFMRRNPQNAASSTQSSPPLLPSMSRWDPQSHIA